MRKWVIILAALLIVAFFGYNYLYQDHRDIESEKPEFVVSSENIIKEFSQDAVAAEQKYLNKTIEIQGVLTEKNASDITLDDAIFCAFSEAVSSNASLNENLVIKGRLIGYDDLLEVIKLDQTLIIK